VEAAKKLFIQVYFSSSFPLFFAKTPFDKKCLALL